MEKVGHFGKYLWSAILHFAHRIFMPLMIVVILYAVMVAGFTALTPWARMYKPQINNYLNQTFHQQIEIEDVKTSWYGLYPVVKLIKVQIKEPNSEPWVCDECWVGFDILRSLLYWHVHPGLLYVDGLKLNIEQAQGHWQLKQAKFLQAKPSDEQDLATHLMQFLLGMMSYMPEKILLKNIDIVIQPEHAQQVTLEDVRLLGQKKEGQYYWAAEANLDKKTLLKLRVDMPLLSNLDIPDHGRIFIEADDVRFGKLPWYKEVCQYLGVKSLKGQSSLQAWIDWKDQAIAAIHANFEGQKLVVKSDKLQDPIDVPSFSANVLWQKNLHGWELAVDKINLAMDGQNIADDKFLLFYHGDWNNYHFYIKSFPLPLLKKVKSVLPQDFVKPWIMQSQGELKELQLNFKDGVLDYFLSEFNQVSWPLSVPVPGVKGLTGVLSWENSVMHLECSSPGIELQFPRTPPSTFENFNAVLSTRKSLDQTILQVENFVLTRPDMTMTLSGEIDEPLDALKRNFRLQGSWSMEHVEKWRPYLYNWLPASGLRNWLQQDVKRIEKASGELVLNGLWQDFPFESADNGEFSVNTYLYGVDLNFAPQWPMVTNIDGQLLVRGRQLEAKIDKGLLAPGLPVKELSLLVPNMGTGKDELLIHGHLQAPVSQMIAYLQNTPLKSKAKSWQVYQLKKDAILDLKLDIPLATSSHNILTQGHLEFPEQKMDLAVFSKPLQVNNIQGFLDFDSQGLTAGKLAGHLGTDSFQLSVEQQTPTTTKYLSFNGGLELDVLKRALDVGSADFMTGHMPLQGKILLGGGASKGLQMTWKSSLKGVKLDIPAPWAKTAQEEKPLVLNVTTQSNGNLNMVFDYMKSFWGVKLSDKVWTVETQQDNFAGSLSYNPQRSSLDVRLSKLWLNSQLVKNEHPERNKPWPIKDMPNIHLNVADFRLDNLNLGQLEIDGKNEGNRWALRQLSVQSPFYAVMITGGVNTNSKGKYNTSFSGEMRINSLGNALEMWGITPVANARDGLIQFKGGWPLALNQTSLKTLDGDLDIVLKKGNITHLDPETEQKIGLGKLLSILSLQTLPRRLQLDFSDLATSGFTYDVFKGHFDLRDGLLTTNDSVMDGPIANVSIQGNLNVLDRWYDLQLQVYPYITASLPVVATIAGGPLAGVATWAANHVINQGMQRVSGYTYKISGPWQQPVVQQVGLERRR